MNKPLIGRPFKKIQKITLIEKKKFRDFFNVTFLDDSTATYNSDNIVVLKSKIIKVK